MSDSRLTNALDDCLLALKRGAGVAECLDFYADLRAELAPLLDTAAVLRAEPAVERPAAQRHVSRSLLMAAIAAGTPPERRPAIVLPPLRWQRLSFVPLALLALAVVVVVFASGRTQVAPPAQRDAMTVLTVLHGEVRVESAAGTLEGANGMMLHPGDRVITSPDARAVLTFFDGSTVTLDPGTAVAIQSSKDDAGTLRAVLSQSQGSTWTHIPQELGPSSIEIDTPSGSVQSRDGSFATRVDDGGRTEVGTQSGALAVSSGGSRTEVTGGQQASIDAPGVVSTAVSAAVEKRELVVRIAGPVYAFLTDPRGATVGTLSPGVPVNQVTGATASRSGNDLFLSLPDPLDGAYRIGLRAAGSGAVSIDAAIRNGDGAASRAVKVEDGDSWTLDFRLAADALGFTNVERTQRDVTPELVTVPDRAVEKAIANQTATPTATATPLRPTATATAIPTKEPTATPTSKPRPTATPTPRPVKTASPVKTDAVQPRPP